MGVEALIDRYLPKPRSGRGWNASRYITPLADGLYVDGGAEHFTPHTRPAHSSP